jgi:hypothetical protein
VVRKLVSKAELAAIFTERLQQLPEGRDCSIRAADIMSLSIVSQDGRNWLPRIPADVSWSAMLHVFAKAQYEFNLEEESVHPKTEQENAPGPLFRLLYVEGKDPGAR